VALHTAFTNQLLGWLLLQVSLGGYSSPEHVIHHASGQEPLRRGRDDTPRTGNGSEGKKTIHTVTRAHMRTHVHIHTSTHTSKCSQRARAATPSRLPKSHYVANENGSNTHQVLLPL
jgi:hypothetical protein